MTDTGSGIPAGQLAVIFEPFERVGYSGHQTPGAGLGLAVSKALVERLGGTLTVNSTLGQGSTFRVQLPAQAVAGDVYPRVVTQGQIADVLQARGQLDDALRIRREEQLPVYERLGGMRELLICRARIGLNYLARGSAADRQQALEYLHRALADAQRLRIPEAQQIEAIIRQVGESPESAGQGS